MRIHVRLLVNLDKNVSKLLILLERLEKQHQPVLSHEEELADRADTEWVLEFLGISLNTFKTHVRYVQLTPKIIGAREYYSKQEVYRMMRRK
ncbi:hypothetical protein SAMN05216436_11151 [bacterium A37T11]|nr:hypothetical protein SAMN05216436_11151 [bacterium A37T11]